MNQAAPLQPSYLDLKTLAAYSSCSVRWLRDRLIDRMSPLPHNRIGGKLLVQRKEFDEWMDLHRVVHASDHLSQIVESVVAQVQVSRRVA